MSNAKRAPKIERDAARREQVLAATQRCVLLYGFHKTSMNLIAQKAKMSVGQIYRYFSGKDAIVEALAAQMTERQNQWIHATEGRADLAAILLERALEDSPQAAEERTILLEMHAEATRNPAVACILEKADRQLRETAIATVMADYPGFGPEKATAFVEYMATFSEGRWLRSLKSDPASLGGMRELHEKAVAGILHAVTMQHGEKE